MRNIVVIRGIGGCGKTTFAAALAARFAHAGVHTLLVSPDTRVPAFGMWIPADQPHTSLGKLLESQAFNPEVMASAIFIPHGLRENLGLLGFLKGEKSDQYSPVSEDTATSFLRTASELADLTIVDGMDHGDMLTATAIKGAVLQVRLTEPTVRGFLSVQSQPPEKTGEKSIWVACPWRYPDPVDELIRKMSVSFTAKVPYSQEAHEKLNEGRLFEPYREKRYRAAVQRVAEAVKEATT